MSGNCSGDAALSGGFTRLLRRWPAIASAGMLAALFVFQLGVARLPVPKLLEHASNDDAFYYLEVAFQAAHGQGWTFDGRAGQRESTSPPLVGCGGDEPAVSRRDCFGAHTSVA